MTETEQVQTETEEYKEWKVDARAEVRAGADKCPVIENGNYKNIYPNGYKKKGIEGIPVGSYIIIKKLHENERGTYPRNPTGDEDFVIYNHTVEYITPSNGTHKVSIGMYETVHKGFQRFSIGDKVKLVKNTYTNTKADNEYVTLRCEELEE